MTPRSRAWAGSVLAGVWLLGPAFQSTSGARPAKILFLLDAGARMRWLTHSYVPGVVTSDAGSPAEESLRAAARVLSADAVVRIATFGETLKVSPTWEHTSEALVAAVDSVVVEGRLRSPIWDAVYQGAGLLETTADRRVIVLISEGRATGNVHGFDEAVDRARQIGVVVHVACPAEGESPPKTLRADRPNDPCTRLKRLAEATGGRYAEPWVSRPREHQLEKFVGEVVKATSSR